MNNRRGFTLIELLVVISVIAVMAGLTIPAISLIQRLVKDMNCGHNLQQIALAIEGFKSNHDERFPDLLRLNNLTGPSGARYTSLTDRKDELLADLDKIFLCPRDRSMPKGSDPMMGRHSSWDNLSYLAEPGCSYLYEMNGRNVESSNARKHFLLGYLGSDKNDLLNTKNHLSWAKAKSIQQRTGNFPSNSTAADPGGAPFVADRFPIIRCFCHYRWDNLANGDAGMALKKVKAVSWNLNIFDCSPFWEIDIDRRFDRDGKYSNQAGNQ